MRDGLSVRPLTPDDLEPLLALHAAYLNYGEGIRSHFQQALTDPATIAVQCTQGGRMIGVDIYTRGVALSGGHPELCSQILALTGDSVVYTGDALLVVPDFRGRGVDAAMLAACRERMRATGVQFVLYELWVHPDGRMPAHRTVERYAHVLNLGLHRDFYVDFDHYGYYCPICGGKCRCSAHLYLCRVD